MAKADLTAHALPAMDFPSPQKAFAERKLSPPADPGRSAPKRELHIMEHPVARHAVTMLRNKETPPEDFRIFSHQLLLILLMESTRSLPVQQEDGAGRQVRAGWRLGKPVIFLSLTRHGLGLAHNIAEFVPGLSIGSVSLGQWAKGGQPEARLHLANAPGLGEARVLLFDPVVATGMSANLALNVVRRSGATDIALLSFLTSSDGLERVLGVMPELPVYTAEVDADWNPQKGPAPGIGNFAERLYR